MVFVFAFALAFALRLRVRAWLGGVTRKKLCGVPPSVNFECVVLAVLWPDVREAN